MEINDDIIIKDKKKLRFQNIITYTGYILIFLLVIYTLSILEIYVLFTPTYYFLKFLLLIFDLYSNEIQIYINIISIIIIIFLHILLIKIIIISIIFASGGLFARFNFYTSFKNFIYQQMELVEKSEEILYFSLNDYSKNELSLIISKMQSFQKAYNNLKMKNNSSFEIKQFPFGEKLNNIIYQYNKYKEDNFKSDEIKKELVNQLKLYKNNLKPYTNFSLIDLLIHFNYYKSLQLFNELLYNSFENRNCNIYKISKDFNIYVISPEINGKNPEIQTLVIFCSQNACCAELFSFSKDNLKLYLNIKEITLIIWNYKGYGLRKGFPSFKNIDKDVELLKEYICNNYKGYKIIIYGISIGGYPAIKLAKIFNDNKNVCLIADRTFADIDCIAETIIKKGKIIYNLLFPKFLYSSNNIKNYIDVPLGNKMIFYDENDTIIKYSQSSLFYHLTLKYYKEIILPKISNNPKYIKLIKFFSEDNKDLNFELRKIKNNKTKAIDENTLIFVKNLIKNIKNLDKFVMYFLIFGYPFNEYKEIYYDKIIFAKNYICLPEKMKAIYDIYKNTFSQKLISFITDINLLFIKCNLIIPFSDEEIINFSYNNYNNEYALQVRFQENLMKYFGFVHRIFCGHNGSLQDNDEQYLKKYLELNEFISDSNTKDNNINN